MKIAVRNLGAIKEADIDLKPLTVLVGPNNAGKTWLAYTLAGIFGPYGWGEYTNAYIEEKVSERYPPLDITVERIFNEGNANVDLWAFADEYGESYFNNVADYAKTWMYRFMSSNLIAFDSLDISLHLQETKASFLTTILNSALRSGVSVGRRRQKPLLSMLKKSRERNLFIYTSTTDSIAERNSLPREAIKEQLVGIVFGGLHQALYPDTKVFPTERTTFVTFPYVDRVPAREVPGSSQQSLQEQKARVLIEPVGNFLSFMSSAFHYGSVKVREREDTAKSKPLIKKYMELAQVLEQQILCGEVVFSTPEPEPGREILFQTAEKKPLEIPIASSMVKELAPLVLYLRYLAEPGELLIIDEPEMNLHPEAQVKLIEFLAMLVNAGLRVLFTTHSTYMVDHLINLMDAAKHEDKESVAQMFFLQRADAFLPKDKVSAYLIDKGEAENILDEEGVIHWDTFSDVTDQVEHIHFNL